MVGYERRIDDCGMSSTLGIRKSRTVRVPRCTNIVQNGHDDFSSCHRVVTVGGDLVLTQAPSCALAY